MVQRRWMSGTRRRWRKRWHRRRTSITTTSPPRSYVVLRLELLSGGESCGFGEVISHARGCYRSESLADVFRTIAAKCVCWIEVLRSGGRY